MSRHFLVIGAQRCGTTYLHELLADHPEIAMARPVRPEPKVFLADEVVDRGVEWYDHTWFPHAGTAGLLGEKSTSYLESPDAVTRVTAVLGRPQIVVQLRDPIERAVSNWSFSRSTAWRTARSPRLSPATSTDHSPGTRSSRRSRPTPTSNAAGTPTTSRRGSTPSLAWCGCSSSRTWSRART